MCSPEERRGEPTSRDLGDIARKLIDEHRASTDNITLIIFRRQPSADANPRACWEDYHVDRTYSSVDAYDEQYLPTSWIARNCRDADEHGPVAGHNMRQYLAKLLFLSYPVEQIALPAADAVATPPAQAAPAAAAAAAAAAAIDANELHDGRLRSDSDLKIQSRDLKIQSNGDAAMTAASAAAAAAAAAPADANEDDGKLRSDGDVKKQFDGDVSMRAESPALGGDEDIGSVSGVSGVSRGGGGGGGRVAKKRRRSAAQEFVPATPTTPSPEDAADAAAAAPGSQRIRRSSRKRARLSQV